MLTTLKQIANYLLIQYGAKASLYIPPSPPRESYPVPPKDTKFVIPVSVTPTGSRPWKGIVVHHSATIDGVGKDTDQIIKFHTSYRVDHNIVTKEEFERRQTVKEGKVFEKPWRTVAYNLLVEHVGDQLTLQYGRPFWMIGAHAGHPVSNRFNEDYIGICTIGNYDLKAPSKAVFEFTAGVCRGLMNVFGFQREEVLGHRETYDQLGVPRLKQCPGTKWDMDLFRSQL